VKIYSEMQKSSCTGKHATSWQDRSSVLVLHGDFYLIRYMVM